MPDPQANAEITINITKLDKDGRPVEHRQVTTTQDGLRILKEQPNG